VAYSLLESGTRRAGKLGQMFRSRGWRRRQQPESAPAEPAASTNQAIIDNEAV
jgi:hypothetical protein